jgi:hypothetical protein
VEGVGYAAYRNCVEAFQMLGLLSTPERLAECAGPNWSAPLRGLEWNWPPNDTLLTWLIGTVLFLVAIGWLTIRTIRRNGGGATPEAEARGDSFVQ